MKSFIFKLAILFTTISFPLAAQAQYPLLQLLEGEGDPIDPDNYPKSNRTKKAKYRNQALFNDCTLVERADYVLPKTYSSIFVKLPDGQTYTGTSAGITMWDNYTYIRITTENADIPENNITALALDEDAQLWIGTKESGIVIGFGDPVKPFKTKPVKTRNRHISSISTDEHGFVWVVFANGGIECFLNGISCSYFPK